MIIPSEWTFNSEGVASAFDEHVREQLPWYDLATKAIVHVARHYIPQGGTVYDIGASTGNIGRALNRILQNRNARFFPIEKSAEMCGQYQGPGNIETADAVTYEYEKFDLCVCFLVLMFLPPKDRAILLQKLKTSVVGGGALIIVDKCLPSGGYPGIIMSRLALAGKMENGAAAQEIIDKELSLSGIQRPIDPKELVGACEFFRFGDFVGWIIEGGNK